MSGRKRQRLETCATSRTCEKLLHMVSRGRISISGAIDLSNCMLEDGMVHQAVNSFASLGTNNKFPSNGERDFHRWLHDLFGFRLQPYSIWMNLQDTQLFRCFLRGPENKPNINYNLPVFSIIIHHWV